MVHTLSFQKGRDVENAQVRGKERQVSLLSLLLSPLSFVSLVSSVSVCLLPAALASVSFCMSFFLGFRV